MAPSDQTEIYRFADCSLDVTGRELKQQDTAIELEPRVFDLLVFLIRNRERAVSKSELREAVWSTSYISDTAMTRAVMKARKAIGDDIDNQAFIRTLRGHGYRFVSAVTLEGDLEAPTLSKPARGDKRSGWKPGAVTILFFALIAALTFKSVFNPEPGEPASRLAVLPLHNATGDPDLEWATLGVMSLISNQIESENALSMVGDGSVTGLAENVGYPRLDNDLSNSDLFRKLKSIYGATHVLALKLEGGGETLRMRYALHLPDGAHSEASLVGNQVVDLAQEVVRRVLEKLGTAEADPSELYAVSGDTFLNEAFARGRSLSLRGQCSDAVSLFELIVERESDSFAPRFEYAACLRILGRTQEAEALLTGLIEEQDIEEPSRNLAKLLMTLGVLYNRTGRPEESESAYLKALAAAQAAGDHELRAKVLGNLGIIEDNRSRWEEARNYINRSIVAYTEAGIAETPGDTWSALANLSMSTGQLSEADDYLAKALAFFREVGHRRKEAMMISNTGYLRRLQGRLDDAELLHLEALEIREEIGDRVGVGRMYNMLSVINNSRSMYETGARYAETAVDIARETLDRRWEASALTNLGDAQRELGRFEIAAKHFESARQIHRDFQDLRGEMQMELKLARLDLRQNLLEPAEQTAKRIALQAPDHDFLRVEVHAIELLADIAAARGNLLLAAERYRSCLERVRGIEWQTREVDLLKKLATAFLDLDDVDAAVPLLGTLLRFDSSVSILALRARLEFQQGNSEKAAQLMYEARDMAGTDWNADHQSALDQYLAQTP